MRRLNFLWIAIVAGMFLIWGLESAFSEDIVWETPYGTFGLPFKSSELIGAYDIKYNQGLGGISLPVYTTPHNFMAFQLGACGAFATQAANLQPYMALGHDWARDIPVLADYQSLHLNVFGRWASDSGDKIPIGYGVGISYSYWGTPETKQEPSRASIPTMPVPSNPMPDYPYAQ